MHKTNAMRFLDKRKIKYEVLDYQDSGFISGIDVANYLKQDQNQLFKTLVTQANSNNYYVFLVPVNKELNLKKAALAVHEKNIKMIKSKDLLSVTGYIHGGCSPIAMKKQFKTIINSNASDFKDIIMNGGKIGYQIIIALNDFKKVIDFELVDIVD